MARTIGLVCGWGVNNAPYSVRNTIGGVIVFECPYYKVWNGMVKRCCDAKVQERQPTYKGCKIFEGWKYFMTFRAWMETQDWLDKSLDKDLLVHGNKIYSPETCCFIPQIVNSFITKGHSKIGKLLGSTYSAKSKKKNRAICSNPFNNKQETLGYFDNPRKLTKLG